MRLQAAVIKEQGQTFAVVVVDRSVANRGDRAQGELLASLSPHFGGVPVTLMWQDSRGLPHYSGHRKDIVDFLARLDITQIPWQDFTLAA